MILIIIIIYSIKLDYLVREISYTQLLECANPVESTQHSKEQYNISIYTEFNIIG